MYSLHQYNGPKEVHYLFVDGGCLRAEIDQLTAKYCPSHPIELDYSRLAAPYSKVFYYGAVPVREAGEAEDTYSERTRAQRELLDRLGNLDRFHVYEGDARKRRSKGGMEQKKVDVLIAVDMLTHTFRRNMHRATLLTGDVDFKPLIDALVREGMFVNLWYPPKSTSRELTDAADGRVRLDVRSLSELTTQRFRQLSQIPSSQFGYARRPDTQPYFSWVDQHHEECQLFRRGEFHELVARVESNGNKQILITHRDIDKVAMYAADAFDLIVPKNVKEAA